MDVMELLHKLFTITNVEIVVALLPEMVSVADQAARDSLLQRLQGIGQSVALRLAEQKMNVFRHDDVAVNTEAEVAAHSLQGVLKNLPVCVGREQRATVITTEGYEMALSGVVISLEAPGHRVSVAVVSIPTQGRGRLSWLCRFKLGLWRWPTQAKRWLEWATALPVLGMLFFFLGEIACLLDCWKIPMER